MYGLQKFLDLMQNLNITRITRMMDNTDNKHIDDKVIKFLGIIDYIENECYSVDIFERYRLYIVMMNILHKILDWLKNYRATYQEPSVEQTDDGKTRSGYIDKINTSGLEWIKKVIDVIVKYVTSLNDFGDFRRNQKVIDENIINPPRNINLKHIDYITYDNSDRHKSPMDGIQKIFNIINEMFKNKHTLYPCRIESNNTITERDDSFGTPYHIQSRSMFINMFSIALILNFKHLNDYKLELEKINKLKKEIFEIYYIKKKDTDDAIGKK